MTYLTKAICRRAGWDYAQVILEQALSKSQHFRRRSRYLIGYGAYFAGNTSELADLTDMLTENVEAWNVGKAPTLQFSHSSFEGWALGGELGEFVYLTHSSASLSHLASEEAGEGLSVIADYQEIPEQASALSLFLSGLPINPGIGISTGALQVTYFRA